jgi:hypothetical protein
VIERRIFAVLSDEPDFLLGISKAKIIGDVDYIGCVVSSTPKLSSAIKERVVDIPFERFITLYPNNSEEFSRQLLSELNSRKTNIVITNPSYRYKVSKEFIERFTILTPETLCQQSSHPRVDLVIRDTA